MLTRFDYNCCKGWYFVGMRLQKNNKYYIASSLSLLHENLMYGTSNMYFLAFEQ